MNYSKNEVAALEESVSAIVETQVRELTELQLAFVGGGIGDVVAG
jgi:hypothetical protein